MSSQVRILSRDVLPAPDGPMMARTWPDLTEAEMPERIFKGFNLAAPHGLLFLDTVKEQSVKHSSVWVDLLGLRAHAFKQTRIRQTQHTSCGE